MNAAPLHFLIVDESKGVRVFLQRLIEGYGFDPHGIRAVSSPEEAMEEVARFQPDFLVTDWFPKASVTGIELFRRIQQTNPKCRLALLSSEVTTKHQEEAAAVGSSFLLVKPFTAEQLQTQIKKALAALMVERPDLIKRMNAAVSASVNRPRPKPAANVALPPLQKLKPGDHVIYGNKEETIDYIVLRDGELIAHLQSKAGFVPVAKLRKTQ